MTSIDTAIRYDGGRRTAKDRGDRQGHGDRVWIAEAPTGASVRVPLRTG
jgi:hypothetical protein